MAGTRFVRNDLIREVGQNYSRRIEELEKELEQEKSTSLTDRILEWRKREEDRLRDFVARLDAGEVADGELSRFEIKSQPYDSDYAISRLERTIADLKKMRDKALAYVRALAPSADSADVVEVSAVDLKRIGYGV